MNSPIAILQTMINLRPTSDINREYPLVKTNHTYDKALIIDPLFSFSLATLLLKKGTYLGSIQKLVGPKSSKTTERYTQVSIQEIGNISNPLNTFYNVQSGTIATAEGTIEPLQKRNKKNKHPLILRQKFIFVRCSCIGFP